MKFWKNTLQIILIIVITSLLIGIILIRKNAYLPAYEITDKPDAYRLPYENIHFETVDKKKIKGWFLEYPDSLNTIIVCHGFGTNKSDVLSLAHFLYQGKYNILLFDFRGHGESEKSASSFGPAEQNDLKGAIRFLKSRKTSQAQKIGVLGGSMGAAVALNVSSSLKEISAIAADCAYKNLPSTLIHHLKYFYNIPKYPLGYIMLGSYAIYFGKNPAAFSPLKAVQQAPNLNGLLIIHGAQDKEVPVSDAYELYESAACPKEILIAGGARHFESHADLGKEYEQKVLKFFKKYL